ncbi:MAG: triphosphoribosyl-dephospho-CoA synthase, partial [Deltaproteobacteria bacterium]|nr:triphosphoribosyl-dephospho-CoA synthase [Deltaproteobacteria bacterium]
MTDAPAPWPRILPADSPELNIAFALGGLATRAMIYEVSCFPAPGLVSPVSQGAHRDMSHHAFIDSACALGK